MRNFFLFGLALVIFGVVVLSYVPIGLTSYRDVGIWRAANMTSVESTNSNAVEVDGMRFEILVPERVWLIPENQSGINTPVQLGIRITNQRQTPVRFTRFDPQIVLGLEIVGADRLPLERKGGRDILLQSPQLACPLVQPGKSLTFFLDAKLFWQNNKLQLGGSDGLGGGWYFDALKPGTYKVRFLYGNSSSVAPCYDSTQDPRTRVPRILQGLWTGQEAENKAYSLISSLRFSYLFEYDCLVFPGGLATSAIAYLVRP